MGNNQARELDTKWGKTVRALGYAILALERDAGQDHHTQYQLTDLRFKLDADNGTSVLVVVKGTGEEGPMVAFTGGFDLSSALLSLYKKLKGSTLKWRVDRPYGERDVAEG